MRIKFWGVRGSIPTPGFPGDIKRRIKEALIESFKLDPHPDRLDEFIERLPTSVTSMVGGNTPCLEVTHENHRLIIDAGTGITGLGIEINLHHLTKELSKPRPSPDGVSPPLRPIDSDLKPQIINLLLTHTHWDHIQGFPFFRPAYQPENIINIYGDDAALIEEALTVQQSSPRLFPVGLKNTGADIRFHTLTGDEMQIGPFRISILPLPHPGGSLAFKIHAGNGTMVFATDYEFRDGAPDANQNRGLLTKFLEKADVFISDTQYTYLENLTKEGWGHSNPIKVAEMALYSGVKKLFLFHHDPYYSDTKLFDMLDMTCAYIELLHPLNNLDIKLAIEGQVVDL
ncbi:MAG: MBL fold metallo-hydrolase [Deltaproteobacteria bacterium]|jgi:phosphoribosyl 1,2-cyclic phosphodiesterase|nr:MBL fold metallo-hydrolase [Deltaproteobacteria bacterium]